MVVKQLVYLSYVLLFPYFLFLNFFTPLEYPDVGIAKIESWQKMDSRHIQDEIRSEMEIRKNPISRS